MSQDQDYITALEHQVRKEKMERQQLQLAHASTIFNDTDSKNLIEFQLDIKEELERIERLLRKHIPKFDAKGRMYYDKPHKEDELFNERGVNEILNLLAWYLNKNIILSNFSEPDIQIRMEQFGNELIDLIFNNYEAFGLDNKEKIKYYPIVVMNIINTIEASYYRALNGGERESLRTARSVTQSVDGTGSQMVLSSMKSKKSIFNPTTWF